MHDEGLRSLHTLRSILRDPPPGRLLRGGGHISCKIGLIEPKRRRTGLVCELRWSPGDFIVSQHFATNRIFF